MYYKEQYVFKGEEISKAVIRNYGEADFEALINIQRECFPPPFPDELLWNREQLLSHLAHYPEGALCIEIEGELAGSLTGMLVGDDDDDSNSHNWEQVTDSGYIRTHEPEGKNFYIVDIGIRPLYRKMELGKLLLQAAYERVIEDRLERVIGGGRMPGYKRVSSRMTAEKYAEKVLTGELKDPVITFLMRSGRTPVKLVKNYLDDEDSGNYALLMEWKNPFVAYESQ
ncbi:GNAT family N-acetyltransferase [Planomicrobium okeanokoites]|uniref:GNAT family N-acetyltransferase n=1 Tax=Planomicrobium okeanokoites TaxID=244 RepID=A0ABV7KIH1_PLAOK|nr:GNAT family N-acetyltransferase [Planomicrobium okeanokoites]TAA69602.1 N-acetyltransferase [Planomicrobium okeanokoites]